MATKNILIDITRRLKMKDGTPIVQAINTGAVATQQPLMVYFFIGAQEHCMSYTLDGFYLPCKTPHSYDLIYTDTYRKEAIIIDIDGTLTNCDHRRHFIDKTLGKPDWFSFYENMRTDTLNIWCSKIMEGFSPLLVSGRPEKYRQITLNWLEENRIAIPSERLFMRATGDYRDDTIVKREIYETYIKPNYDILFVIDDRKKVIDVWRSLGLIALHCAEGNF